MKLTKNRLKQIIKEEFSAVMNEDDDPEENPVELLQDALTQMDRVRELAQKAIEALGGEAETQVDVSDTEEDEGDSETGVPFE